ncbi:MAG TPA: hypothetical protein PLB25_15595 [Rhodoferax sp.]|nr:hypothetical protein [Rhodoferax sp.]
MKDLEVELLATFVEFDRHKGICDKSAKWINLDCTAWCGKRSINAKPLIALRHLAYSATQELRRPSDSVKGMQ